MRSKRFPHRLIVYEVDFHPDGKEFAAGGMDSAVTVYNLATKAVTEFRDESWWVTGLAYTPDGSRLATASTQQITFWDTASLEKVCTFGVNEEVRRVGFLPDGSGMITTSLEGQVRLWKALPPGERLSPR